VVGATVGLSRRIERSGFGRPLVVSFTPGLLRVVVRGDRAAREELFERRDQRVDRLTLQGVGR
jgi:hypothetical protein